MPWMPAWPCSVVGSWAVKVGKPWKFRTSIADQTSMTFSFQLSSFKWRCRATLGVKKGKSTLIWQRFRRKPCVRASLINQGMGSATVFYRLGRMYLAQGFPQRAANLFQLAMSMFWDTSRAEHGMTCLQHEMWGVRWGKATSNINGVKRVDEIGLYQGIQVFQSFKTIFSNKKSIMINMFFAICSVVPKGPKGHQSGCERWFDDFMEIYLRNAAQLQRNNLAMLPQLESTGKGTRNVDTFLRFSTAYGIIWMCNGRLYYGNYKLWLVMIVGFFRTEPAGVQLRWWLSKECLESVGATS